jgi:hypothetical protein
LRKYAGVLIATAVSVVGVNAIAYPFVVNQTLLAQDWKVPSGGTYRYRGVFDAYKQTMVAHGMRGIYRGFWLATLSGTLHTSGRLMLLNASGILDAINHYKLEEGKVAFGFGAQTVEEVMASEEGTGERKWIDSERSARLARSGLAMAFASVMDVIVYPIDTVRTRLIAAMGTFPCLTHETPCFT